MKQSFLINFIVMTLVGICFNPMNILAYRLSDLYLSKTLIYGGFLMASNMIWSHQIIHYLTMGHFNQTTFLIGVVLSIIISKYLLRNQYYIDDNNWLKRMISHHSTAITTSKKILKRTNNKKVGDLASEIIKTQEKEIKLMKSLIV
tara:strand:+ start:143 stop:580 length:438 start_codon:yes stop_codon:yes gene_type:complete